MSRRTQLAIWISLVLALLSLSGRLLWLASRTETGLETLASQWWDATCGWVIAEYTPIPKRQPTEQADFWLQETDRVLRLHGDNPAVAMGAALVLDSPGRGYEYRYLRRFQNFAGFGLFPDVDQEGLQRAQETFETKCRQRCVELSARAAELEPANVEWWRLRALLLWSGSSPRDPNWAETLEQCARHDPDNALYDYLAARFYWESGADIDVVGTDLQLTVKDQNQFQLGTSFYERGQAKPYSAIGDAGFSAAAEFLSYAAVHRTEQDDIVNSREIHAWRAFVLRDVCRWQQLRADAAEDDGDVKGALALYRKRLHAIQQFASAGAGTAYDNAALFFRIQTAAQIQELMARHGDLFSEEQSEEFRGLDASARLERKVLGEAGRIMAAASPQLSAVAVSPSATAAALRMVIVAMTLPLAILLALVGAGAFALYRLIALSRLIMERDVPKLGMVGHTVALVGACALSVVVFGLAPAEVISRSIQSWVLTVSIIAVPVALASYAAWTWLSRRAFKFSLRTMLSAMTVLCVVLGLVSITRPDLDSFTQLPFDLSIPAVGSEQLDARSLEAAIRPLGTWLWVAFQWANYFGQYLTVAIWGVLAAVLLRYRLNRTSAAPGSAPQSVRRFLAAWSRSLRGAAIKLSGLTLIVYLALAPGAVEVVEKEHQRNMAFARNPGDHWSRVEAAIQKVRSDRARMEQLRSAIEIEMRAE